MGIEAETVEAFFRAVSSSLAAVDGRAYRHRCDELGRCVYDERCPLVEECMPSDYVE